MAPITRTLIALNAAIMIASFYLLPALFGGADPINFQQKFFLTFGLVPQLFFQGFFWQPLTSMFLHGGFMHLLFNMVALYSLGQPLEHSLGSKRYAILYLVSGLLGSLLVILFQGSLTAPTVGASGAIMGLLGALAVFYPDSYLLVLFFPMRARTAAIVFAVFSLVAGLQNWVPGLSHFGHLGGLIGGILVSRFILRLKEKQHLHSRPVNQAWGNMGSRFGNQQTERQPGKTIVYHFDPRTGKFVIDHIEEN